MSPTDRLAEALIAAQQSGARADAAQFDIPDYAAALSVQRRVSAALGPVAGFKVAPFRPGAPILAPIPAARVHGAGAEIAVGDRMGIELEIGFELLRPVAPQMLERPAEFFRPRLVIELVDQRLAGTEIDPLLKLADLQLNHGLVLGPALPDWDGSDFTRIEARLRCGETRVIDGMVEVPGGSALANLALLCAHVGDHCGGLQPGQHVITGSVSGLSYFPAGTEIAAEIAGFGALSLALTEQRGRG